MLLPVLTAMIASVTFSSTYQRARCGVIVRIGTSSSQLPARYMFDGHNHDWS